MDSSLTQPPSAQPVGAPSQSTDVIEIQRSQHFDIPQSSLPTVQRMQELFGADLPEDVAFSSGQTRNPALQGLAFLCNYDEGFCGHFSIPQSKGAAADFDRVMAQPSPLQFVKEHLNFGTQDNGEWILLSPGLNTLHVIKPGWEQEQTAPQRLEEQYQPVLGMQMSHMHLGTDMDQGEAVIPLSPEVRFFLEQHRAELEGAGLMPRVEGENAIFHPRQRDRVETLLSQNGYARPQFQNHVVRLLQANETAKLPMVWLAYSRSTPELSGALQLYLQDFVKRGGSQAEAEAFLGAHLTVVTIGNAIRQWPDGPAYVHYAAWSDRAEGGTDPLTRDMGVHARNPQGAGRDAVFVHPDGLFSGFDAHNFGAVGAATLKLIMDMNGVTTFRGLWTQGRTATLRLPSYEQIAAKVVLTAGADWLWEPNSAWHGVTLPDAETARRILAA